MRHKRIRNSQPNLYIIYNNICAFVRYVTKKLHHLANKLYQQAYHHTYILPLAGLGVLSFLGINLLNPNTTEATYATDEGIMLTANTATPTATLSVSNSGEQRIDVQPGSGTVYSNHIVSMSSVNIASYALTISGPANLSSASGKTILTGANGATGSSMGNNTWGYSYNKNGIISDNNAATFTSFSGSNQSLESGSAPSTTQKSLVLAVKFADDAEAGHYTGAVSLSLTATPKTLTTYSITYNANNGSGAPSNWSDNSYDASYSTTISSTTPTRSGYNFLGWSTSSSASSASYSAGQTVMLSSSSPTLQLHAVWEKLVFNGITTMQQMTSAICTASATGDTKTLTDTRDNNTYTVTKLKDGKCWMTQNLRLAGGSALTSANSNVSSNYTLPSSTSSFSSTDPAKGQMMNSSDNAYGAYYSFNAATANTAASQTSGNAPGDICPKGWRLPIGNTSGEFYKLAQQYPAGNLTGSSNTTGWTTVNGKAGRWLGAANATSGGAFFPAAGLVLTSGLVNSGSDGYYWSSTINSADYACTLRFNSTYIIPASTFSRYYGFSVRCVAR